MPTCSYRWPYTSFHLSVVYFCLVRGCYSMLQNTALLSSVLLILFCYHCSHAPARRHPQPIRSPLPRAAAPPPSRPPAASAPSPSHSPPSGAPHPSLRTPPAKLPLAPPTPRPASPLAPLLFVSVLSQSVSPAKVGGIVRIRMRRQTFIQKRSSSRS